MTEFPLNLIRQVLRVNAQCVRTSAYKGPAVAALYSRKYGRPMVSFCISSQSSRARCQP